MGRVITILQVLPSLDIAGAEKRIVELNHSIILDNINFDYLILSKTEHQYFEKTVTDLGGSIYKISSPREVGILRHICQLCLFFSAHPYTIVHSHTSYHSGIVLFIAYLYGAKLRIAHARTKSSLGNGFHNRIIRDIGRLLIKLFSNVKIAISHDAAKYLFGEKTKVTIVPNGINIEQFSELTDSMRLCVRNKLNITENDVVYGHIGRFDPVKNHCFLLKIFKLIHRIQPHSKLIIIGDGVLKNQMELLVNEMGIASVVYFLGTVDCVAKYLNAFDVLIFPSIYEGLGNVVIEAQLAGLPCIVSDNVPKEVAITELVQFKRLENNELEWAKTSINAYLGHSRKNRIVDIEKKGYDIKYVTKFYVKLYTSLMKR